MVKSFLKVDKEKIGKTAKRGSLPKLARKGIEKLTGLSLEAKEGFFKPEESKAHKARFERKEKEKAPKKVESHGRELARGALGGRKKHGDKK